MRFSTSVKKVVMLLYHRAQNNWNTDKKTETLVYEIREKYVFGCRGKKHTLKMLEKIQTA